MVDENIYMEAFPYCTVPVGRRKKEGKKELVERNNYSNRREDMQELRVEEIFQGTKVENLGFFRERIIRERNNYEGKVKFSPIKA